MQCHDIFYSKVIPVIAGTNGEFYIHYVSSEAQVYTQSKQMLHLEYTRVFLDERKETNVSPRGILVYSRS
jgi:hypothetical protein